MGNTIKQYRYMIITLHIINLRPIRVYCVMHGNMFSVLKICHCVCLRNCFVGLMLFSHVCVSMCHRVMLGNLKRYILSPNPSGPSPQAVTLIPDGDGFITWCLRHPKQEKCRVFAASIFTGYCL